MHAVVLRLFGVVPCISKLMLHLQRVLGSRVQHPTEGWLGEEPQLMPPLAVAPLRVLEVKLLGTLLPLPPGCSQRASSKEHVLLRGHRELLGAW